MPIKQLECAQGRMFYDPSPSDARWYSGIVVNHQGMVSHLVEIPSGATPAAKPLEGTQRYRTPEPEHIEYALVPAAEVLSKLFKLTDFLKHWLMLVPREAHTNDPRTAEDIISELQKDIEDASSRTALRNVIRGLFSNVDISIEQAVFETLPADLLGVLASYEKQLRGGGRGKGDGSELPAQQQR